MQTLVFRPDGGAKIGTGHVMRCLALAQAWMDAGGRASFVMSRGTEMLDARIGSEKTGIARFADEPHGAVDARCTVDVARELDATWVVVDGYEFRAEYQDRVRASGLSVMYIDDNGDAPEYVADAVLNQNSYASSALYPRVQSQTELLLGTRYALLRREFASWRGHERRIPPVAQRLLITLGGADLDDATSLVVRAAGQAGLGELEVVVLLGAANDREARVRGAAAGTGLSIRVERDTRHMARWMAWADMAVTASGTTCWEVCFMGLPTVAIVTAENQQLVSHDLAARGALNAGGALEEVNVDSLAASIRSLALDVEGRRAMRAVARTLVDGLGGSRVVSHLLMSRARA